MVALAGSLTVARAQERGGPPAPPPEPKNLQVFPKTMTTAQILPIMRNFSAALGTNCGYCHQWTGAGAPGNDFSVDIFVAAVLLAAECSGCCGRSFDPRESTAWCH
jgi:hypothetical protein